MDKAEIFANCTYSTFSGANYYVHEIVGQKIIYCRVGEVNRREASLGRFAAIADHEIPNG